MNSKLTSDSDFLKNNFGKSILPIPTKKFQLSAACNDAPNNTLKKSLKPSNSSKSLISDKSVINIHRRSSIPKLIQDPNYIPSIVSSVLYLKNRSNEVVNSKIHNFQGGGFRGLIKKSKKINRLLPSFEVKTERKHLKTHSQGDIVKLLKKHQKVNLQLKNSAKFNGNVLGRKILSNSRKYSIEEYY